MIDFKALECIISSLFFPLVKYGALLIDSIPPATTTFACPEMISLAAIITAFKLEPHTLLIVVQGVEYGNPELIATCLAGACPEPACNTWPM